MARVRKNKVLPELGAFFVCEKVLKEADNVFSIVRIVDTLTLSPTPTPTSSPPKKGEVVAFPPLTLYLLLKSGEAKGERKLRLRLINPSHETNDMQALHIDFTEPSHGGHNVMMPLAVKWDKPGLYWFEVFIGNSRLGRTPLFIQVKPPNGPGGGGSDR